MYASDLQRAQDTAHLLLTSANESLETLLLDNRLREISKGARQGYPLSFTYTEALQERRNNQNSDLDNPIHKLETEDEGWERIQNWLNDVVREAVVTAQLNESHDTTAVEQQEQQQPLTVLAVAHAGIYRIFLRRLIGDDRLFAHPAASFDPIDGRFAIPNTSLTVLNVTATLNDKGEPEPIAAGHEQVDIVQLTWRGHTQDEQETVKEDETTTHTTL
jgi:broad specificity phosphatase PhoE